MSKSTTNVILMTAVGVAAQPECRTFAEIYGSGQAVCENMWGGAFKYETNEAEAYTMWFFDAENNPNAEITAALASTGKIENLESGEVDQCYLQYFHKPTDAYDHPPNNNLHPSEEPERFTECHPWSESSCCFQETVDSAEKLRVSYGAEYHWDRCGPLSPACERFFVQEACFYECEPSAGIFRKFRANESDPNPFGANAFPTYTNDDDTPTWQLHQMPIKASYCNSWYAACKDDFFCASDSGDYFSCAREYKEVDDAATDPPTDAPTTTETSAAAAAGASMAVAGLVAGMMF